MARPKLPTAQRKSVVMTVRMRLDLNDGLAAIVLRRIAIKFKIAKVSTLCTPTSHRDQRSGAKTITRILHYLVIIRFGGVACCGQQIHSFNHFRPRWQETRVVRLFGRIYRPGATFLSSIGRRNEKHLDNPQPPDVNLRPVF